MELQQLRYVAAVARTRNFTRAAAECFVVQSALSHQIKALENELGVPLFARTSRRVDLTAAGQAFLPWAADALRAAERAAQDARAAAGTVRGTLRLGTIPTLTALDLPAELARFHAAHPDVRVTLEVGSSDDSIAALRAGHLDVALLGLPASAAPDVPHRVLTRHRLVAVVGAGHRLAGRRRVRLADLADEVFADFPAGSPGRAQSDEAFAAAGLRRSVAFESMAVDLMLGLVERGLAIALLAPQVVPSGRALHTVAVPDGPQRVEYLAWSDFNPSPAAVAFLGLVGGGEEVAVEADERAPRGTN